jgi:hypothetical protein
MRPPYEHPSDPLDPQAPLSLTEKAVFCHDAQRCPETGRVYEQVSGAHPRHIQSAMFKRQADIEEALRQAEAAAAAEQKPGLRLVRSPA